MTQLGCRLECVGAKGLNFPREYEEFRNSYLNLRGWIFVSSQTYKKDDVLLPVYTQPSPINIKAF